MEISNTVCAGCGKPMAIQRLRCNPCNINTEGEFELPPLALLSVEDQVFVLAFLRNHGSIKKMEALFSISYPTVKNRLIALVKRLDQTFEAPTSNSMILEQLAKGEITTEEALERLQ